MIIYNTNLIPNLENTRIWGAKLTQTNEGAPCISIWKQEVSIIVPITTENLFYLLENTTIHRGGLIQAYITFVEVDGQIMALPSREARIQKAVREQTISNLKNNQEVLIFTKSLSPNLFQDAINFYFGKVKYKEKIYHAVGSCYLNNDGELMCQTTDLIEKEPKLVLGQTDINEELLGTLLNQLSQDYNNEIERV